MNIVQIGIKHWIHAADWKIGVEGIKMIVARKWEGLQELNLCTKAYIQLETILVMKEREYSLTVTGQDFWNYIWVNECVIKEEIPLQMKGHFTYLDSRHNK